MAVLDGDEYQLAQVFSAYLRDLATRAGEAHCKRVRAVFDRITGSNDPPVSGLRPVWFADWRARRLAEGISRSTANKEAGYVRGALEWAREMHMVVLNPAACLRPLPVRECDRRRLRRALTDEELTRLLRAAKARDQQRPGVPQHPTWLLLAQTGARRGEACAVRWCDVDLVSLHLTFRAECAKSGRSRVVPIDESLAGELIRLRRLQEYTTGRAPGGDDQVLLSPAGRPWMANPDNLGRLFGRLLGLAKIERVDHRGRGVSVHALRHTFITRLIRAGVQPVVVQQLAGHADVQTTLGFYTHTVEKDLRDGIRALHLEVAG